MDSAYPLSLAAWSTCTAIRQSAYRTVFVIALECCQAWPMAFHVHPYQQDKWDFSPVLKKITNRCKHHGVYPEIGFLTEGTQTPHGAFQFEMKVHCPVKDCEFYRDEFSTTEWNDRNPIDANQVKE
jgi:hypothetical protein